MTGGDRTLSRGYGEVHYFDEEVSPFAGFDHACKNGFALLHAGFPSGRKILYATPKVLDPVPGWKTLAFVNGLQFIFAGQKFQAASPIEPTPLFQEHVNEMVDLATLTRPGPFGTRTIEFGYYHGIFVDGHLAAMTGQRLHVNKYTEISAVCTHPDHLGKGFAAALLQHQVNLILDHGQIPFLHVRADNARAINLYERLGFKVSRHMNFYFMKKIG